MKDPRVWKQKALQFQTMNFQVWLKKARQFQSSNIDEFNLRKLNSFNHRTLMSLIKENSTVSIIERQWVWFKKARQFQSMKDPRVWKHKSQQFQSMKYTWVWFKKALQFQTMNFQVWLKKARQFQSSNIDEFNLRKLNSFNYRT